MLGVGSECSRNLIVLRNWATEFATNQYTRIKKALQSILLKGIDDRKKAS